jgi:hypothetical protein
VSTFNRHAIGACLVIGMSASLASASFHLMQIEQVMLSLDGDHTVQAIQLRLRSAGQNQVQFSRVRVFDAAGANPILLVNMAASVPVGSAGARVLIVSPNFAANTTPGAVANFTMTGLVPASYLAGGRMTFESDTGAIYWSLSWGNYTGPQTGELTNDSNGNFGPAVSGAFPTAGTSALRFVNAASAPSTTNLADYTTVTSNVTFINNAGTSFIVNPPTPPCYADYNQDGGIDGSDVAAFFADWENGASDADVNQDGGVDGADVDTFFTAWEAGSC